MSLTNVTNKIGPLACNGSTTLFNFTNMKINDADDLEVTHTTAAGVETILTRVASAPTTDEYTVTGVGLDAGGSITTGSTYASGETITMVRAMTFDQQTTMSNLNVPRGDTVEDMVDKLTMMALQLKELVGRSATLPVSTTITDLAIPDGDALKALRWNAAATALENVDIGTLGAATVTTFSQTVIDDDTAFEMLNTLTYPFDAGGLATTSGTAVDLATFNTALTVKRLHVHFDEVSLDVGDAIIIQLGTSSGVEATGYASRLVESANASSDTHENQTTGIAICRAGGASAGDLWSGSVVLARTGVASNNVWVARGVTSNGTVVNTVYGRKALADTCTRLRLTSVGTRNFDNGSFNVVFE